jgi:hypothetical protein
VIGPGKHLRIDDGAAKQSVKREVHAYWESRGAWFDALTGSRQPSVVVTGIEGVAG